MVMNIYQFLSRILSPWLMPTYLIVLFFYRGSTLSDLSIAVIFFSIIPTLSIFLSHRLKYIKNVDIYKKEERCPFYLLSLLSYFVATFLLLNASFPIFLVSLSYFTLLLIITVMTFFWKVSFHAAGASNFATLLVWFFGPYAVLSYLILIVIYIIRLKMKIHTLKQLLVGTLIPLITTSLIFLVIK